MSIEEKKAWVTGASGMIGLALTKYLLDKGVAVTAVIREHSQKAVCFPEHPALKIVECDLEHLGQLDVEGEQCDYFFHLGWSGTTGEARDHMYMQNQNVRNTLDAVELAHRLGAQVFVGAGSQAEYGRVEGKLTSETPVHPETGYGMAKLCAGQMSRKQCQAYGIRHIWMRILSVYGPYNTADSMIMSGIHQMLEGQRPSYTKGEQMWDYLYVKDAARALYLAAIRGKSGKAYCLGSGQARPLADYIWKIRDAVASHSQIGLGDIPYGPDQVMYLCADLTEFTADTGFLPEYSFEEGIRETVAWVKEQRRG